MGDEEGEEIADCIGLTADGGVENGRKIAECSGWAARSWGWDARLVKGMIRGEAVGRQQSSRSVSGKLEASNAAAGGCWQAGQQKTRRTRVFERGSARGLQMEERTKRRRGGERR